MEATTIISEMPAKAPVKLLLTIDEAAAMLSLGRTLCYSLVMRGEIPSIKVGRVRRVPTAALHDFVTRQLVQQ